MTVRGRGILNSDLNYFNAVFFVHVDSAVVQKYLLEKSRICSQGRNERNYHVFYYLLAGASEVEKHLLHLQQIEDYNYLNKVCHKLE